MLVRADLGHTTRSAHDAHQVYGRQRKCLGCKHDGRASMVQLSSVRCPPDASIGAEVLGCELQVEREPWLVSIDERVFTSRASSFELQDAICARSGIIS